MGGLLVTETFKTLNLVIPTTVNLGQLQHKYWVMV